VTQTRTPRDWRESQRENVVLAEPKPSRRVKNLIWTAIISIVLASAAFLVGVVDIFVAANLVPVVQGAGLASIAFGLAGLAEKVESRPRQSK
jgi:hypothetical protein